MCRRHGAALLKPAEQLAASPLSDLPLEFDLSRDQCHCKLFEGELHEFQGQIRLSSSDSDMNQPSKMEAMESLPV